jgi:8-hydroxy-5-deazaflavin:NADPH oxidoreductase
MSSISIIGTGNMARAIGVLAVAGGNTVEVIGRDQSKAADLAKALGGSTTTGEFGAVPTGDIVIVALLYANVVPVVTQYGDALAGKVIVDISNPFNSAADGLAIPDDTSIAQEVAKAAPASASVVKAFNTIFGVVLAQGRPLDVFIGGVHREPRAAPAGRRRLEHGALAGRNGPGRDGPCQPRSGELRLRPRRQWLMDHRKDSQMSDINVGGRWSARRGFSR